MANEKPDQPESPQAQAQAQKDHALASEAHTLIEEAARAREVQTGVLIRVLKVLLVTAPVNFVVASGPLLLALAVLAFGWCAALAIAGGSAYALVLSRSFEPAVVFFLLGIVGIGILFILMMMSVSSFVFRGFTKWLRWNLRFLMGREG